MKVELDRGWLCYVSSVERALPLSSLQCHNMGGVCNAIRFGKEGMWATLQFFHVLLLVA